MTPVDLRATRRASHLDVPLSRSGTSGERPLLLVLSDRRWSVVYQRTQHLLTRLAHEADILFVEEPVHDDGAEPHLVSSCPAGGVEVLVPHVPTRDAGFEGPSLAHVAALLSAWWREQALPAPVAWLNTPMALPLLSAVSPAAVVYDRGDDHGAASAGATRSARDAALLRRADLVLCASPTLHARCRARHPHAQLLPDAIDAEHFDPERLWERSVEAADAAGLHDGMPRPRLGFFGVIDERVDLGLLDALARRRPDWQVVMAGPVLLPDPERVLPRHPNLHWLGRQSYAVLPYLQAQWDVCLLPYATGPRTRYLSLARPLEYLAGGKPVVSTALPDVVARLGEVVRTAEGIDAFIAACEATLAAPAEERVRRRAAGHAEVARCSWDRGASRLRTWLAEYLRPSARIDSAALAFPAGARSARSLASTAGVLPTMSAMSAMPPVAPGGTGASGVIPASPRALPSQSPD